MELILKAARVAKEAHSGQMRKWPDQRGVIVPYITHPAAVAQMIVLNEHRIYFKKDERYFREFESLVAAAWLHDVVEDTPITLGILDEMFPGDVVKLVMQMTNVKHPGLCREDQKKKDRERLDGVSYYAKLIKMCDRYHNLTTIGGAPESFRWKYAQESRLLVKECFAHMPQDLVKELNEQIDHVERLVGEFKANKRDE